MPLLPLVPYAERHARLGAVLDRRAVFDDAIETSVRTILDDVRQRGDAALLDLTERFDGVRPDALKVSAARLDAALEALDPDLRRTLEQAAANVRRFHQAEMPASWSHDDGDDVTYGQRISPVERAGLYVPAGTAPLPSSVIMNAVPALVAGVDEIHVCSPPGPDGLPHPLILATARLLGMENVYAVGGAQAIGALAFGTESVPRVDVVVGDYNYAFHPQVVLGMFQDDTDWFLVVDEAHNLVERGRGMYSAELDQGALQSVGVGLVHLASDRPDVVVGGR
mgnify:CR=1 FL=1